MTPGPELLIRPVQEFEEKEIWQVFAANHRVNKDWEKLMERKRTMAGLSLYILLISAECLNSKT